METRGQAHQGGMDIKSDLLFARCGELIQAVERLEQAFHFLLADHGDPAPRLEKGGITAELDRVAEALLPPDQNGLARQVRAVPGRLGKRGVFARVIGAAPAEFVLFPGFAHPAAHEEDGRTVAVRFAEHRRDPDGGIVCRHRGVGFAQAAPAAADVVIPRPSSMIGVPSAGRGSAGLAGGAAATTGVSS